MGWQLFWTWFVLHITVTLWHISHNITVHTSMVLSLSMFRKMSIVAIFLHGRIQWYISAFMKMTFCQTDILSVICNKIVYSWENFTSTAILPTFASDIVDQHDKIGTIFLMWCIDSCSAQVKMHRQQWWQHGRTVFYSRKLSLTNHVINFPLLVAVSWEMNMKPYFQSIPWKIL